jgi:hypothetical protein
MQSPDLTAWLAQPADYAAGVQLYARLGSSATYQQLFAQGETRYSRQLLVRALQALAAAPPLPRSSAAPLAAPASGGAALGQEQALQPLRSRKKACRDERDRLRAQLTAPRVTKTDRQKMCARICELTDQVYQLEEAEKHVIEHGRLPGPVPVADEVDAAALQRRLTNLIAHRSRIRKRPERVEELPGIERDIALIRSTLTTP